ncbi:hypothetical protein PAAG_11709 [Paracoccidioides lutzii Pb01]|uniref:Complex 1 LYR protein domain-containing protein n=1 Tax=Paracoccidioides lutzii (strain ATCC MYA-826 / Pb01) TaxID=502779 RepID=A0A0A2V1A9_PARBA|nr:hypothetical protein PAAG_11709 [Paracoccidioides lutzii Pb01]KGQ01581.1 hypothetical protein PAAG_11709 [Paracoccidioides lutzii Pb01]
MRWSARLFLAAASPRKPRTPALSLEHFIQRQRALSLWREIVRAFNKIPQSSTRDEMRSFARHEFERHKDVTDLVLDLAGMYTMTDGGSSQTGKSEFEAMRRYIDEMTV